MPLAFRDVRFFSRRARFVSRRFLRALAIASARPSSDACHRVLPDGPSRQAALASPVALVGRGFTVGAGAAFAFFLFSRSRFAASTLLVSARFS